VHPEALAAADDLRGEAGELSEQLGPLLAHLEGEMTRQELQTALGLDHRENFRKAYLLPALEAGLVEMVYPDKPKSRAQRYRLTKAGMDFKELRREQDTAK
jgi:ATP-dependent DNA helicase RecG